jgi:hypothetical protein
MCTPMPLTSVPLTLAVKPVASSSSAVFPVIVLPFKLLKKKKNLVIDTFLSLVYTVLGTKAMAY